MTLSQDHDISSGQEQFFCSVSLKGYGLDIEYKFIPPPKKKKIREIIHENPTNSLGLAFWNFNNC